MFNYSCPHADKRVKGLLHYLYCKKIDNICPFQRFCPTKREVEHTTLAPSCEYKNDENKIIEGD